VGHEDAFLRPRLSTRCRFSQGTFAATRGNGRDAPKAVVFRESDVTSGFDLPERSFLSFHPIIPRSRHREVGALGIARLRNPRRIGGHQLVGSQSYR
jgi:hypothetical protein